MNEKICCIIGCRTLPEEKRESIQEQLRLEFFNALADGYQTFLSSFAGEVDQYFASMVIEAQKEYPELQLNALLPHPGRLKNQPKAMLKLLTACHDTEVLGKSYSPGGVLLCHRRMIEQSDRVIAVYDERTQGASFAIQTAKLRQKDLRSIAL